MALRGSRDTSRVPGFMVVVYALCYTVTPQSAGGPPGSPVLFYTDLRFLLPALALGLVLLARCAREGRRTSRTVEGAAASLFLVTLAVDARGSGYLSIGLGVCLGLTLGLVVPLVLRHLKPTRSFVRRRGQAAAWVALGIGALVLSSQGDLLSQMAAHRYVGGDFTVLGTRLDPLYRWAWSQDRARIAIGGDFPLVYPLYGRRLSNSVGYIGPTSSRYHHVPYSCQEWRRRLRTGRFQYVVVSPGSLESDWAKGQGFSEVVGAGLTVARVREGSGSLDSCNRGA
jgi:hypothetical protein